MFGILKTSRFQVVFRYFLSTFDWVGSTLDSGCLFFFKALGVFQFEAFPIEGDQERG